MTKILDEVLAANTKYAETMHIVWTVPGGLTWLFIVGCAVATGLAGYGIGYRRGVKDAVNDSIREPDHSVE